MRIIIAGAGAVGRHLAKLLSREDMDISLIDDRQDRLGVNDQFVEHGSTKELYHLLKLDKEGICESLLQALEQ